MRRSLEEVRAAFPELVRERDALAERVADLNAKINAAAGLFRAFGEQPPTVEPATMQEQLPLPQEASSLATLAMARPVEDYIEELLSEGKAYKWGELRDEIERRYGLKFAASSIYRILTKGNKEGRYASENGCWQKKK